LCLTTSRPLPNYVLWWVRKQKGFDSALLKKLSNSCNKKQKQKMQIFQGQHGKRQLDLCHQSGSQDTSIPWGRSAGYLCAPVTLNSSDPQ
jgi:hypothetical protein